MLLKGENLKVTAYVLAAALCAAFTASASASAGMLNQAERYSGLHEGKNNKTLKAILGSTLARHHGADIFSVSSRPSPEESHPSRQQSRNPGRLSDMPFQRLPLNPGMSWSSEPASATMPYIEKHGQRNRPDTRWQPVWTRSGIQLQPQIDHLGSPLASSL